jgi:hypothetical protein
LKRYSIIFVFSLFLSAACQRHSKEISFYYWRTHFHLDSAESKTLQINDVKVIHVRYFDVVWNQELMGPVPVQPIVFDSFPKRNIRIIPVVYFTSLVFEQIRPDSIRALARSVYHLISAINHSQRINTLETQFDCDWIETTKDKFFQFLKDYKSVSNQLISSTIRLHQIKYPGRTGIPPVDYGVLMFYNMGKIEGDASNSIYEKSVSENYSASIQSYPLSLDLALPIFSWSLQIREGKVIHLLNKMSFSDFENLPNFRKTGANRYQVIAPVFTGGYYFMSADEVKVEWVSIEDLKDIVNEVNKYSNHKIRNVIFYDLDKKNLKLYEQEIFRNIADHTD